MQLLSAQLAGSQHAERAARIVNQIITTFRRAIRDCTDREDRAQNRRAQHAEPAGAIGQLGLKSSSLVLRGVLAMPRAGSWKGRPAAFQGAPFALS